MAKNKKSLLNESAVRRFMKLAEIDTLSDQFIGQHYLPEQDDEEEEEMPVDDMSVDDAPVDDAPVDDMPVDDAPVGGAEAEITPEAAEAIVDLAAQLEASGAVGGDEVDDMPVDDMPVDDMPGDEMAVDGVPGEEETMDEPGSRRKKVYEKKVVKEDEKEVVKEDDTEELEEQLKALGIEIIDDSPRALKEAVYKRVIKRLRNEQKKARRDKMVDKLVEGVFVRIQKETKK